jgi:hypothetical protein
VGNSHKTNEASRTTSCVRSVENRSKKECANDLQEPDQVYNDELMRNLGVIPLSQTYQYITEFKLRERREK